MIEVGMKAPQFILPDKNGNIVSLSDFLGKKVVLYRRIQSGVMHMSLEDSILMIHLVTR